MSITAFACGQKCDHVFDAEEPLMQLCVRCMGEGHGYAQPSGKRYTCPDCKGSGQVQIGMTRVCAKCKRSAYDIAQWEGP